jgi:hypothetical protein
MNQLGLLGGRAQHSDREGCTIAHLVLASFGQATRQARVPFGYFSLDWNLPVTALSLFIRFDSQFRI